MHDFGLFFFSPLTNNYPVANLTHCTLNMKYLVCILANNVFFLVCFFGCILKAVEKEITMREKFLHVCFKVDEIFFLLTIRWALVAEGKAKFRVRNI